MSHKILFVDDDPKILESFSTLLRKRYEVITALGPEQGLDSLRSFGPFAVVVSDLKMPKFDGITFLSKIRQMYPDVIRIMLTGFADTEIAMKALNEGKIFRFLTKPCPMVALTKALDAGINQYSIVTAEREILQKTLRGSVRVLIEALSLANPAAYGRTRRIRLLVHKLAKSIGQQVSWVLDLSVMLSQIGCMSLPCKILDDISSGRELSPNDLKLYNSHPIIGAGMIEQIPRLGPVATIIAEQGKDFQAEQPDEVKFLKIALDYDFFISKGLTPYDAFGAMLTNKNIYAPMLLETLGKCIVEEGGFAFKFLNVDEFQAGMTIEDDVVSKNGSLFLKKHTVLTDTMIQSLIKSSETFEISEPIAAILPSENTRIDLSKIIDSLLLIFKMTMDNKFIKFNYHEDNSFPKHIFGMEFHLKQILFNLISNSCKFSETGQISICVSALPKKPTSSYIKLLLIVSDSGQGVPDDKINDIFLDIHTEKNNCSYFNKSILGMQTVKILVNLMNGSLCIDSTVGLGTDVYFTMDVSIAE